MRRERPDPWAGPPDASKNHRITPYTLLSQERSPHLPPPSKAKLDLGLTVCAAPRGAGWCDAGRFQGRPSHLPFLFPPSSFLRTFGQALKGVFVHSVCLCETESHAVTQAGLELIIQPGLSITAMLLLLPPECWAERCEPLCPVRGS